MMTSQFSTASIPEFSRFDYWEHLVADTFKTPTSNRLLQEKPFHGMLSVKHFGSTLMSRIQSSPIEYRDYEPEDNDNILIALSYCDTASLSQHGKTLIQDAGDIVVYDSARSFSCSFPCGDNQIVLSVPRRLFLAEVEQSQAFLHQVVRHRSPLGLVSAKLISDIWRIPEQPDRRGDKVIRSVLSMLDSAFSMVSDTTDLQSRQSSYKLQQVHKYLYDNLSDSALSPETIAQDTHMSARTLNRLFAREGTTLMRWLWQARLQACYQALVRGRYRTITETAFSFGFTDMAHFSRLFKSAYGLTASQLLEQTRQSCAAYIGT